MEIEKKRETSWKIDLKKKDENIALTSVEISGEVRLIKLTLIKGDKSIEVEMKKEQFFNFLSIIAAFKDVVIGEDTLILDEDITLIEEATTQMQQYIKKDDQDFQIQEEHSNEKSDDETEELNPEEWDPW